MYAEIADVMWERVVLAEDFLPFIDHTNWLLIDDDPIAPDAIYKFIIRRVFTDRNQVEILIYGLNPRDPDGKVLAHFNADELALRMEAA